MKIGVVVSVLVGAAVAGVIASSGAVTKAVSPLITSITLITDHAGRLDWGPNNVLALDRRDAGQEFYQVYTMNLDGSNVRCITCNSTELPKGHRGNPAWHPSGKFILFQAAQEVSDEVRQNLDQTARGRRRGGIGGGGGFAEQRLQFATRPGQGWLNDLWVTDPEGKRYWRLTTVPPAGGVLHPHFNEAGDRLAWGQRIGRGATRGGEWDLRVADFSIEGGEPRISNVRTFQPTRRKGLIETHNFIGQTNKVLFTATPDQGSDYAFDVFSFDFETREIKNLTNTPDVWDEHSIASPSGKHIVWMSSQGFALPSGKNPASMINLQTEYWIMNADGSDKQQLTSFNKEEHGQAADFTWNPEGTEGACYFQTNSPRSEGKIFRIKFARAM